MIGDPVMRRDLIRSAARAMRSRPSLARKLFPLVSSCECGVVFGTCGALVDHLRATGHVHSEFLSREEIAAARGMAVGPEV